MDLLVQIRKEVDFAACCAAWCRDVRKFSIQKPCCGYTLVNGFIFIAVLDVIGAMLTVLPLVILLVSKTLFKSLMQEIRQDLTLLPMDSAKTVEKSFTFFLAVLTLVISISLLEFYLAVMVLNAHRNKKLTSCFKWWRLLVTVLIAILFLIAAYIIHPYRIAILICGGIICLYKLYCFWVVWLFVDQIGTQTEKDSENNLQALCEIDNFTRI